MATITSIKARQIFDSLGNPTVEVDVHLSNKLWAIAAVPSGASTGIYEALELRMESQTTAGRVSRMYEFAVSNVNTIIGAALIGKLEANAILAVSLAVYKAGATVLNIPLYKVQHIAYLAGNKRLVLPVPAFNFINGGSHARNELAMQEFTILPVGASSFKEAMKMGVAVYHNLKAVIEKKYGQDATNVGDGVASLLAFRSIKTKEGLELLKTAIDKAGYTREVVIGMDVAASEFYGSDKTYDLNFKEENNNSSQKISGDQLKYLYKSFVSGYPIRVEKAIKEKTCNALLLKVNQIGSVTESTEAVKMSKQAGWGVMASHHSGEIENTFIVDLSVGLAMVIFCQILLELCFPS
ncbi:beta-enolase isoform X1 [Olea europaea subsp. europaea]|uniref:phosphopyruvate hydratase n=1 Tax=Olea europaea subsp. europaea TaxID=158383 RepID=A0A8S0QDP4_OLEEU|nr:beta-enolase isoform X1 [Olea europaea subsp. europaea]